MEIPVKYAYQHGIAFVDRDRALITSGDYKQVEMYDIASGELVDESPVKWATSSKMIRHPKREMVVFSASGRTTGFDFEQDKKLKFELGRNKQIIDGQFSTDGKILAAISHAWDASTSRSNWTAVVWDTKTKKLIRKIPLGSSSQMRTLRLSVDGKQIFVQQSGRPGIKTYSIDEDTEIKEPDYFVSHATSIDIHPTGEFFAAATYGGISIVNMNTGEIEKKVGDQGPSRSISLSPNGEFLLVNTQNTWPSRIEKIKIADGEVVKSVDIASQYPMVESGTSPLDKLDVVELFKKALGASDDTKEDVKEPTQPQVFNPPLAHQVNFASDGKIQALVTGPAPNSVAYCRWNPETAIAELRKPLDLTSAREKEPNSLVFTIPHAMQSAISPDGRFVVVAEQAHSFLYDTETGQQIIDIPGAGWGSTFSPDSRFLVIPTGRKIQVWDTEILEKVAELPGHFGSIVFCNKRNTMFIVPQTKKAPVTAYDIETWAPVWEHNSELSNRTSASISKDGNWLVFGMQDCRIQVWDLNRLMR